MYSARTGWRARVRVKMLRRSAWARFDVVCFPLRVTACGKEKFTNCNLTGVGLDV
jgi:hypothetical protein